jgi:hypothetical protein
MDSQRFVSLLMGNLHFVRDVFEVADASVEFGVGDVRVWLSPARGG